MLSKEKRTVFCISPIYLSRQRTLVLNCLMNHVLEFVVDRRKQSTTCETHPHTTHYTHAYNNEIYKVFQTKLLTKQESNPTLYHTHTHNISLHLAIVCHTHIVYARLSMKVIYIYIIYLIIRPRDIVNIMSV